MNDDHDKIIEINVKLDGLIEQFSNHLKHHFRYSILAWSITLTALISLILMILKN